MEQYIVTGMSCAACQARVEKAVAGVPGVTSCAVSLLTNSMGVEGEASQTDIIKAVEAAGYGAAVKGDPGKKTGRSTAAMEEEALKDRETPKLIRRLILSLGFLIALMYLTMGHHMLGLPLPAFLEGNITGLTLTQMILAFTVMLINGSFFKNGFRSVTHLAPNMDTLVAMGSSVSFAWSVCVFYKICGAVTAGADPDALMEIYHTQLYFESAAMIPALITVGKMLEAMSKGRTTDALKSLVKLSPKTAVVVRDGVETEVMTEEVSVGDIFIVRPGESIPVDGVVTEGAGAVDESALTGESIPVDKTEGDKVSAATINREGMLKCRAERVGEDTTLSQIIELVANAAATKAPIARVADRVSGVFVPAVIAIALAVTLGWLIAGESPAAALERGICVLVISCPCALGLATPVAIMVGSGKGAKNGILYKTGASLEQAGRAEIVALDKTGTITTGRPEVTGIYPAPGVGERELLVKAASIEYGSEHPLAVAVTERARAEGIEKEHVTDFMNHPGRGIEAGLSGRLMHGGNREYIREYTSIDETEDLYRKLSSSGKTPIYFEEDGKLLGILAVADKLKSEASGAIGELKRMGIRTVMLTGDNRETAEAIAKEAGIDEVAAGILPDGKEAEIRRLKKEGRTVMVGDGINDAPALAAADTGIAIGAGTDVAIDSADIVLMNSSVKDVAATVRLGRATLKNIHENLFWAFFYNVICIPLAAGLFGMKMDPMLGAAAMSLSSFTVCMNALRLNGYRLYDPSKDRAVKRKVKSIKYKTTKEKGEKNMEKTVKIEGMMCGHCAASVKKALEELDFISGAEVSHETGTARITLTGEADTERIRQAIEEKDYKYIGIE